MVIDWAMNSLLHFYREKIEERFVKDGMPCHESIFFKRVESSEVQKFTVTHVADESDQTATQLHFTMSDLLKQIKTQFSSVTKATIQSDNAGCYHASALSCSLLFAKTDMQVKR